MARVTLFNGRDWEPLDWEVPATAGNVSHELNHSTMVNLDLPAEYNQHEHHGFPWAYKNMAHVAVEDDAGHVYAGIIKDSPTASQVQITAHGHSVLSKDFPWHGSKGSWAGVDGIRVFRDVWDHIISNGGISRLELVGAASGGSKVGKPASPAWARLTQQIEAAEVFTSRKENRVDYWERELNKRARDLFRVSGRKKVGEVVEQSGPPGGSDIGTYKAVIELDDTIIQAVHFWEWQGVGGGSWLRFNGADTLEAARNWRRTKASLDRANDLYPTYVQRAEDLRSQRDNDYASGAPEPYELTWWDARDLSSNLEEIRELGNFDWHDTARFDDNDDLIPGIQILAETRAVREDIHLELGVNVHDLPEMVPGDSATHIHVLGEGEGDATIKAERTLDHPRMVPVYRTVSDKDYRTQQLAEKAADKERDKARKALGTSFSSLTVTDHPLAPISSFRLGDRVPLVGELRDGTEVDVIVTVTSIQRDLGGNTINVEVELS